MSDNVPDTAVQAPPPVPTGRLQCREAFQQLILRCLGHGRP